MSVQIDELYQRVMTVIEESAKLADASKVADMGHIQSEVEALCLEIQSLPVEERVTHADKFGNVQNALAELEKVLRTRKDEVEKLLSSTDQHKKANNAYARTELIDHKPKSSENS